MQPDFSRPVLAVDTGTSFLSLALQTDGRILSRHTDAGNKQSDLILPQHNPAPYRLAALENHRRRYDTP